MAKVTSLTVLAIDGAGRSTRAHVELLEAVAGLVPAREVRLLSSDRFAAGAGVDCVRIPALDYRGYSRFCVENLANFVSTEYCLCVQLDGFVINPKLWDQRFLDYDYVGAPWVSKPGRPFPAAAWVGNGGFSLRSRRFLECAARLRWHDDWSGVPVPARHIGNEDYFLCVLQRAALERSGVQFAPVEVAGLFSQQSGDRVGPGHDLRRVFGFHGKGLLRSVRAYVAQQGLRYPHLEHRWFRLRGPDGAGQGHGSR